MNSIIPATPAQATVWCERIYAVADGINRIERRNGLPHTDFGDLGAACNRIARDTDWKKTIEGGAAWRIMRTAYRIRKDYVVEAGILVQVAKEVIQHENIPSPKWLTMCDELGFPAEPTGTEND